MGRDIVLALTDLFLLGRIEPLYPLAILPQPELLLLLIWVKVSTQTVLLALVPPACVDAPIWPLISSITVFLALLKLPVVAGPVPVKEETSVHVVVEPLAIKDPAVLPVVFAIPRFLTLFVTSFVL